MGFAPDLPARDWALLLASGAVGISIADTMFFYSLEKLGAGLTAVVDTSYTPVVLTLSACLLGERLTPLTITGGALIMGALILGSAARPEKGRTRREIVSGSIVGVLGIALMAVAIVAIKGILNRPDVDTLWATWIRVLGGLAGTLPLVALHPRRRALLASLRPRRRSWTHAALASLFGTYLAMVAWVGGMKYCAVSRAALLNQLSTIFIFVFATVFLKERLTARRGALPRRPLIASALLQVERHLVDPGPRARRAEPLAGRGEAIVQDVGDRPQERQVQHGEHDGAHAAAHGPRQPPLPDEHIGDLPAGHEARPDPERERDADRYELHVPSFRGDPPRFGP